MSLPVPSPKPRYERASFHPVPLLFGSDKFPSVVLMNILSPSSEMSIAPDGYPEISEANSESKVFSAPVLDHLPRAESSYKIWFISWPFGGKPPADFRIIVIGGNPCSYDAELSPAGVVGNIAPLCPLTPNGLGCFLGESERFMLNSYKMCHH
ncbi:hypothetical protein [Escherichia sp. MOD1-EC6096]|uniref:hypothetical protein n=1 Tax=Escherichia sp. MOD1-EC6096 TaxID=2093882 RepID=UPI00130008A1|nr:hypothetical protein [Escherichia sp. MOD1-EC6096]